MDRRSFLETTAKVTALTAVGATSGIIDSCASSTKELIFSQNKLAYAFDALEPNIDALTMQIHYEKHHQGYIKKVNAALASEQVSVASETKLFQEMSKYSEAIRNNSGGAWNHNFFWESMTPKLNDIPDKLAKALGDNFGSVDNFKEAFQKEALTRFGSGWAWLIEKNGQLVVGSTPNQDNPLMDISPLQGKPLLALDVWEHAYYLHYQNKRAEYATNWWNVVDWEVVANRLG